MKSKIGLILTWGMIISGALGFIVFGNKEGRFKYYQDGLSITIQNQTNPCRLMSYNQKWNKFCFQ